MVNIYYSRVASLLENRKAIKVTTTFPFKDNHFSYFYVF